MSKVINIDPEILGGTPVFSGTRVPIESLFDHLEDGVSLDEFLDDFPTVSREQAVEVWKWRVMFWPLATLSPFMKLLLDENLPKRLKQDFQEFEISTVRDERWNGLTNGELIERMLKPGFDA